MTLSAHQQITNDREHRVGNPNKESTIKQMSKIADRLGGYAQADNYAIVDLTKYKVTEK